jgi:hypothetical protein
MKRVVDVVVHEADRGFRGKKEKRWRPAICPAFGPAFKRRIRRPG